MSEQIFVSYRRDGGDVTAKLICEALKNRGYTVFYDYDSICGGYFDDRIITAIENCNDFVLVLPKNALDRCINEDDWVRQEITCAMQHGKNIIPVLAPDFVFPKELPKEIENVSRINGIQFVMAFFEAVMGAIVDRLISRPKKIIDFDNGELKPSEGLEFKFDSDLKGYSVKMGKCTDTEIVIPKTYEGKVVVAIGHRGFKEYSAIRKVVIPDTVVKIDDGAFNGCSMLEEVTIPDSVTEIGGWAFYGCTSLRYVIIPKNVCAIGKRAFTKCTSVSIFSVDEENNAFCAVDGHLFTKNKQKLVAYALGKQETAYVVPDGVKEIADSAFSHSDKLESVTIPDSVTDISSDVFYQCSALKNVTLSKNVKVINEDCFRECTSLESIDLHEGITCIGKGVFYKCSNLKYADIPNSVREIGQWAFYECGSLEKIIIPQNVQAIDARAFCKCEAVQYFSVDADNKYFRAVDGNLYTKDMRTLVAYAPENRNESFVLPAGVQNIEDSALSECRYIKYFTASKELEKIGDFAFSSCSGLERVTLPKSMIHIGANAFKRCVRLESIVIPKGITGISEDAFRNCTALKSVTLPRGLLGIGESAFNECANLERVTIPDSVTEIGKWSFYGCTSLKTITIPKNVKYIGARALAMCTMLESIRVSAFNKNYCSAGKHLYTKDMKTIVAYALASKEISYELPDSVKRIEDSAFSHSVNLMTVTLPRDLESVGEFGLYDCTSLKQVNYKGTVYSWKSVLLGKSVLTKSGTNKVNCTDGTVDVQ